MKCATFTHDRESGWSDLSAAKSADLVLMFGCSSLLDHPDVIEEVAAIAPGTILLGCSTAGEILGTEVRDGCAVAAAVEFDSTPLRYAAVPISAGEPSLTVARSGVTGLRAMIPPTGCSAAW